MGKGASFLYSCRQPTSRISVAASPPQTASVAEVASSSVSSIDQLRSIISIITRPVVEDGSVCRWDAYTASINSSILQPPSRFFVRDLFRLWTDYLHILSRANTDMLRARWGACLLDPFPHPNGEKNTAPVSTVSQHYSVGHKTGPLSPSCSNVLAKRTSARDNHVLACKFAKYSPI